MCGICGRFSIEPTPASRALWNDLIDVMWRRGPDDRGLLYDQHCVLGARRLCVMDLSGSGHLPMESACGRFQLAFNGELYNFAELRVQLQAQGHRFRSSGDSEVVLTAFQQWGLQALDRFNGMFALAFYDRTDRSLTVARDHAGIKPLYVLEDPRGIVFASQYDQIMAHPWASSRSVDPEAVGMYLRLGHIPAPRGYLRGTGMLPPGSWLRINPSGRVRRGRWFRFTPGARARPCPEEIETVIAEAVTRQSVSDAPIGSLLSGGIDSPLVASLLAQRGQQVTSTYSIGMQDSRLDESEAAAAYAAAIRSVHRTRVLDTSRVFELVDEAIAATCEPLADEGMLPSLLVSHLAREDVTVALSGEGGDELFWGYWRRQSALLAPGPATHSPAGHRYLRHLAEITPATFAHCFPDLDWWPGGEPGYDFDSSSPERLAEMLRLCEYEMYLPFILLKADRASMHHSLELRVPLLDREVVELSQGLTFRDCMDFTEGLGKMPLRHALERQTGFSTRAKRGFTAPIDAWIRGLLRDAVSASLRDLRGLDSIEIDRSAVTGLLDRHLEGQENNGTMLWRILCLDRWLAKEESVRRETAAS